MSDYEAIEKTVFDYFDGYKAKDRTRLERAFAVDIANLMGYWKNPKGEKELFSRPMRQVIDTWTDPGHTPLELGEGRMLSVNIFSSDGATVVFDFGGRFLDAFQLVKMEGRWRIVNKFFVDH